VTEALLSPAGRELLDRLAGERVDPGRALELAQALRGQYPPDLVAAALTQQELRIAGLAKFSRAEEMLFTRAGLEQASSEITSAHAAARYPANAPVADLCCGIGGNSIALASTHPVLGVDLDPVSLAFARHNAGVYGVADGLAVVRADVRDLVMAGVDAVFIDPARRAGGRRLAAGHSEPPLGWCLDLAGRVPAVGIKAAPGLPRELVPADWEAEFVAIGRDLKEALLWSPALATAATRATVLPSGDTLAADPSPRARDVPVAAPGAFLFDPSPAVTRAGLVEDLADQLGAWKIDPAIAFLSDAREHRSPFARTLRVLESAPWHERDFARRLRELGIGAVDIRRRGLAGDVPQIHRRLGLRGPSRATLVLTRVSGRPWGLICTDPADPG
jgi:SAM-dependent methyltransferase